MPSPLKEIVSASCQVLDRPSACAKFGLLTAAILAGFILLLVASIPGNTLAFQLQILRPVDYLLFLGFSLVMALLIFMQIFVYRRSRSAKEKAAAIGRSGLGTATGIFGGLLATAACSSCIAAIFGLIGLGTGAAFFIIRNRTWVIAAALVVTIIAVYLTARRVNGHCKEACEIKRA
jgi:hypothetical protein